jgi:predicted RNA-binding protein Jag
MKEAEFEGRSEEEALLKASQELGVNIADMTWEVLAHESGLFGLFGKVVKIRVRVPENAAQLIYRKEYVPGPGDTGLRRTMGGEGVEAEESKEVPDGSRPAAASRPERSQPPVPTSGEAAAAMATGEKGQKAKEVLEGLLQRLEIAMDVTVRETADEVQLNLAGADGDDLVGHDGELLSALQFLVNKIVNRFPEDRKLVVLDAEGFRNRREEVLGDLARRMGEKALATRKVVRLRPMSAQDRRLVHMALKETPGLQTRSEGEGSFRCLLIIPDGFARR